MRLCHPQQMIGIHTIRQKLLIDHWLLLLVRKVAASTQITPPSAPSPEITMPKL
jgi:hypothetical protein